jgi:Porin PorA
VRRVLGVSLTGLGAFLVGLGLMFRLIVPGMAIKDPLNEHSVTTLTGQNMEYFSTSKLQELTGVSIKAINTVNGDVASGTSSIAVWDGFTALNDTTNNAPIEYSSERLAFNRRTGLLQNCCGAAVGSNSSVHMSGIGYVWPIGAQKKTYEFFDTTLLKPVPVTYDGTATVDGESTDKFVENVNDQQFGTQTLPGSLVGVKDAATVTLPEFLTATNTFYVDPLTGAPVSEVEKQSVTLQDQGVTKLVLLRGTLSTTASSIASAVKTAQSDDRKIAAVQDIIPVVGILLGLALIVLGAVLIGRLPEADEEYIDEDAVPSEA